MRRLGVRGVVFGLVVAALWSAGGAEAAPSYQGGATLTRRDADGENPYLPGRQVFGYVGSWSAGTSFAYSWHWAGNYISRGSAAMYTVSTDDVGHTMALDITGTDSSGSTTITVEAGEPVTWPRPTPTAQPSIQGVPSPGHTVTVDPGTWVRGPGAPPGPVTLTYWWAARCVSPLPCATQAAGNVTSLVVTDDMVGTYIQMRVTATYPDSDYYWTFNPTATVLVTAQPPAPTRLSSSTNLAAGQTMSGVLHWTVQASGNAHSVKFYNNNALLREVVADGSSWAFDLDTKSLADGTAKLGYDIFNAAGQEVYSSPSFSVTVKNAAPGGNGGGSGGSGGSGSSGGGATTPGGGGGSAGGGTSGGGSSTTTPQTQPIPSIPPITKPPISAGKPQLVVAGFAQTGARRGGVFAVAMFVVRSTTGKQVTTGTVTCTLAGKKLVWHGWFRKAAGCRWAIPADQKPIRLRGMITVRSGALQLTRKVAVTVAR